MQHPEEGIIHAWLDGALPADEAAALESHVASCKECAAAVAEARGLIAASSRIVGHLDAVPGKVIPAIPRKRRLPSWRSPWVAAIAAGLILFVRGYLNWPDVGGVRELPPPRQETPGVIRPNVTDSMPVARPPAHVEPQQAKAPAADSLRLQVMADSNTSRSLPPANMTQQKSAVVAAQPTAAPIQDRVQAARMRAPITRAEVQEPERKLAATVVTGTAGGTAAGAGAGVAPAPASAKSQLFLRDADDASLAFVGCYEMNTSTEILPARFALAVDSSTIRGLQRVQYVDADGKPASPIADLGWTVEGGQVVVKTQARETLLTLRRTGSAVVGEGRSGSRNGRVTSCSR